MYWSFVLYCHLEISSQIIEAKNSVQLHEVEILEVLQKDSYKNSDMTDIGAEEKPDEMAAEKVVETGQADHSSMRNLGDSSTPDYMYWKKTDFVLYLPSSLIVSAQSHSPEILA